MYRDSHGSARQFGGHDATRRLERPGHLDADAAVFQTAVHHHVVAVLLDPAGVHERVHLVEHGPPNRRELRPGGTPLNDRGRSRRALLDLHPGEANRALYTLAG